MRASGFVWVRRFLAYAAVLFLIAPPVAAATLPQYRFTKIFDTSASGITRATATAVDESNNVYITGNFSGTISVGGVSASAGSNDDAFVAKYRNDGTFVWIRTFDVTAGNANGAGVAVDKTGNVYITGDFTDTVVFDGVGGSHSITTAGGNQDAYLTKFTTDGTYVYTRSFDVTSGIALGAAVTADSHNNVYITGTFTGTPTFGGTDTFTDAGGSGNVFTTKYNADGSYGWTKVFDTTGGLLGVGMSIAVDASDNVYAGGVFSGTVVFDGTGGSDSRTDATGDGDTYITKYTSSGSYIWTKSFDTTPGGYSYGSQGLAIDRSGDIYTVGAISGAVTFNPGDTKSAFLKGAVTLVKYNADGSYGWSKVLSDAGGWSDGHGVAVDSLGDIYTTGEFYQTVAFDGGGDPHTSTAIGSSTFLTKYNADGSYAWTRTADTGSNGLASGLAVAADSLGNVFEAGVFEGTVVFDGIGGSDAQTDAGAAQDTFLTSFAAFVPASAVNNTAAKAATKPRSVAVVDTTDTTSEPAASTPVSTSTPAVDSNDTNLTTTPTQSFDITVYLWFLIFIIAAILLIVWVSKRRKVSTS